MLWSGWEIFNSGEVVTHISEDNRIIDNTASNELDNHSETSGANVEKLRHSNTPQGLIQDIENDQYLSDYDKNDRTNTGNDTSHSEGSSTSHSTDSNYSSETTTRTPADKIKIMQDFQLNIQSIWDMIFKDLEKLFYQIIM